MPRAWRKRVKVRKPLQYTLYLAIKKRGREHMYRWAYNVVANISSGLCVEHEEYEVQLIA